MAGLPPGDPQLVSMIVNHLKTQGLFDQFRRDCLADVDTKPAYLNLKQRVDNFVSNHLSNHTWSPHLNKNQLRNNIRQLVLQSGMLEQGVDRIVAQVVDPKINHTFRPQVERVVQEFLSPGSYVEEYTPVLPPQEEEIPELPLNEPAPSSAPVAIAGDVAMSILDTITTLNQEATSRASSSGDKGRKGIQEELMEMEDGEQEASRAEEEIESKDDKTEVYAEEKALLMDIEALEVKTEDALEQMDTVKDNSTKSEKMEVEGIGNQEVGEDGKDKGASKTSVKSKDDDPLKSPNEKHQIKQKARERLKEEYSLEDSDLDGLSDITVSSVHTSDLSSFEEESDDEQPPSSSDDGQLSSDDEGSEQKQTSGDTGEDKERKPRRQAYVHKPFLYSRYYSDSDDEVTVEQRRRSAAKDKEDRLLKRQQNRERMEEKRRLKATQLEEQAERKKQKADSPSLEGPRAKEARKERKVLEKKMALNRKRKRDSRNDAGVSSNKKGDAGVELNKKDDGKLSSAMCSKQTRKLSESDERRRRKSGSVSEDSNEPRKISDKNRTHSFILDLEQGAEELLKRPCGKFDRPSRKESHTKDRRERDRSLSEEHSKVKHKLEKKGDGHSDEARQKDGADAKLSTDDRGDKKSKGKGDKKMSGTTREVRASLSEGGSEEGGLKEAVARKGKGLSSETTKVEKEREKEKVREKEKDKERVKEKEKEKIKNEKVKSDLKLPQYSELTGSPEERSDMDPLSDGIKKKEKQPRETPKRSKSQTEDKQVEKPKSKPDGKDAEKEKPKAECGLPESQKVSKHGSDMDRDPRKTREAEKGKALEKSRSKSREELKALKVDRKPPGPEVKSKAGAAGSRSDTSKERKRDGSAKERKGSEDIAIDKLESKSAKKVSEKKKKMLEKKGESLEETIGSKGEEPSAKSSISSPSLDTEGSPRRATLLKDTSTDSDPAATATTACDDAYDALSDITPEPEDGDLKERLREVEPCSLPAEADALLTLMDVCASADARLEPRGDPGGTEEGASRAGEAPARAIQDADIKMKEAALTLLSMDPDCKASPSSVATGTQREPEVGNPTDAKQMETSAPKEHVQALCKTYPTSRSTEKPLAAQDALGDDKKEPVVPKVQTPANVEPLEDGTFSKENQKGANNEKISDLETPPELIEAPGKTESEPKEAELESVDAEKAKTQFDFAKEETMVVEENQVKMDVDNISGGQIETEEDKAKPQSVKSDAPVETEEVRQTRRGRPPKLVKQSSNASKSDGTVDDKDKVPEHRSPRRGRLSKSATGDEEEQPTEAEQPEETPVRRSRRSGEQAKENPSSHQKKDAERKDEDSAETTSVKNPEEKPEKEEKTEQKRGGRRGRPAKFPSPKPEAKAPSPQQGATEEAAGCQSSKTIDARKPALKRKRSEEPEELNTESLDSDQPERGGTPPKEEMASPTEHRAEEKEEGPGDGKPEESSPQGEEDKETPQKKPLRRGRAWKRAVAASEHSDDKEMDPKEEEEDGDIQDDEEGSKAVTKTRAASRLEAERNKPSKPSTRARGQNAREELAGGTRGTRGQAAAATKGGRKRDASPPAVRTRGGQKSEEPPSKRAKR